MGAASKVEPIDNHLRAADLLAEGYQVQEIADELGVHRSQVWRWLQRDDVAERLVLVANTKIGRLTNAAVEWMKAALNDVETPHAVKLGICRLIFERVDTLSARVNRTINGNHANATDDQAAPPQWKGAPYQVKRHGQTQ